MLNARNFGHRTAIPAELGGFIVPARVRTLQSRLRHPRRLSILRPDRPRDLVESPMMYPEATNPVAQRNGEAVNMRRTLTFFLYAVFVAALSWICFLRPVSDDFDRYIYEALVRGRYQDVQNIYPIVKHENPRAEASSVLDSPAHLAQLEPLYAIRPLYLEIVAVEAGAGEPIQPAITLVSALSLFGIGMVLLGWTHRPAYCALLMATPAIVLLGRIGTPDALSSLLVLSSMWAIVRERLLPGFLLLLVSIWVRTDNVLLVFLVLVWLAAIGKLSLSHSAVLALLAAASVVFINHFSGNYG